MLVKSTKEDPLADWTDIAGGLLWRKFVSLDEVELTALVFRHTKAGETFFGFSVFAGGCLLTETHTDLTAVDEVKTMATHAVQAVRTKRRRYYSNTLDGLIDGKKVYIHRIADAELPAENAAEISLQLDKDEVAEMFVAVVGIVSPKHTV